MSNNVFLVSPSRPLEDRFTAHWCGLLSAYPVLAQLVVDRIARFARLPQATFQAVVDHPSGTAANRPDCLLQTDKYEVICEHKLDGPLGPRQLERYLEQCGPRTYLALIATQRLALPAAVSASRRYVTPSGNGAAHFLWRDFYADVAGFKEPFVEQFRAYMEALGMSPLRWGTVGDPFIDADAAAAFRELYRPLAERLGRRGVRTVVRSNSLVLQIKYARPDVPLFYVRPTQWDGLAGIPITGRLLHMRVLASGTGSTLPRQTGFVAGRGPTVFVDTLREAIPAEWKRNLFAERDYFVRLDDVLHPDSSRAAVLLEGVVERALAHLEQGKGAKTVAAQPPM